MKDWLLKTPLFAWAYRQGGIDSFALAQKDILDTMADDLDRKAEILSRRKMEALLTTIDEESIVKLDASKGILFIGSERPTEARLANLKAESEFLLNSDLWRVIYETPKALAQKSIFMAGDSIEDVRKGRSILYMLETQKKIIDTFLTKK